MLALVTGGDRGIGFAIARKLAENGYDVIIAARDRQKLAEAAKALGVRGSWIECDVADNKQIKKLEREVSKIGELDVLVNNAGVAYYKELAKNKQEEVDLMLEVNLRGLIECTRAFLPGMLRRKKGHIINISSGAGKYGFPNMAVYCATKFGVIGFSEALGREVASRGVHVFAICPGGTDTDMWHSLFPGQQATYSPEDVAIEVIETIRKSDQIEPGGAIDVRKHV
jgi:short-subunit dehydrogenase